MGLKTRWKIHQKNKFNNTFGEKEIEIVKIAKPLVKVSWLVDGEKLTIGYIMRLWIKKMSR
jgi:hypothetical protein